MIATVSTAVTTAVNHPYIATYLLLSVVNPMVALVFTVRHVVRFVWK
jgi:hypothetical protein